MGIYQQRLPQLQGQVCITDGGLETDLCFNMNYDLPEFASYDLLRDEDGYATLYEYYKHYAQLASRYKVGLILETPTWRANADWGEKIGDTPEALRHFNLAAVKLLEHIREDFETEHSPIVISGCLGPRGDGYTPGASMNTSEAKAYHSTQINTFADANVDMIAALTLNYIDEAIGVTQAAQSVGLPVCISFTVETDGKLPTGETLEHAIAQVDQHTNQGPAYYMINCAHPTHFDHLFATHAAWHQRLKGLRGNASCMSHAELDNSDTLDDGNPVAFGKELGKIRKVDSHLTVLGGCCGTDLRHITEICKNLTH
ncbi:homocysteine S-methyltransferase family protein [Aestuariicella hydrocarbonica]|uniref:Homocysteine S-methyltransferase family protein n=1 Tax=Pseudomaricurvus hydrocarbonicus TaxID=1470433 RepID=A0A9E5JS78_9GAMM|nr:homocysteine S-methyltransferase family protein [Aestuariicella hydrocarbonica]NHO65862.1 homocysteine S-methyltransferase family protein [Aestuariicella hydrocarbonica]